MPDARNAKPLPARPPGRPPEGGSPGGTTKPMPARGLAGSDGPGPEPTPRRAGSGPEPDVEGAALEVDGARWTVRVLGRSGRAGSRGPPLLLLGFWPGEEGGEQAREAAREATVVGRALAELTPSRLEEALAASAVPPRSGRRKPFFEAASQGRGGGSGRQDP